MVMMMILIVVIATTTMMIGHHHTGVTGVVSDDNRTDSRLLEWEAAFALDFGHNWENAYTSNNTQQHTLPKDYDEVISLLLS